MQGPPAKGGPVCRPPHSPAGWKRYFPFLSWIGDYQLGSFSADVVAGVVVAVLLVPQAMAYALLAGLPPQVGLYAALLPPLLYPLFGTSRFLAVGPVAMVSLLVASSIASFPGGQISPLLIAAALALITGAVQLIMGIMRLGVLVNFLSHPVLSGFTSAAAIIIGFSQLKHLLGINLPQAERLHELVAAVVPRLNGTNWVALVLGLGAVLFLFLFSSAFRRQLRAWNVPDAFQEPLAKSGPLIIVAIGTACAWWFDWQGRFDLRVIGEIPSGLPSLALPRLNTSEWLHLIPGSLVIVFVGFLESISVAKSLAARQRQRIEPDQELIALGVANLATGFTGGCPVTGGFSRSVVNFSAGARTGIASIVTALLVGITLLALTPLFHHLPQTVLAAIILVAVAGLVDFRSLKKLWRYNASDASAWVFTFVSVLFLGIETGILIGLATTVALFLWRTSRPHMAVIGRVGDSEHFRNVARHETRQHAHLLMVRIDGSLYFANTKHFEDQVLCWLADRKELRTVVLVCSAINFIDSSALETLSHLVSTLREQGVDFHMAEVKGPVLDQLRRSDFLEQLGEDHLFLSADLAVKALAPTDSLPAAIP